MVLPAMASGVGEGAGMRVSGPWLRGRVWMTLVGVASLALVLGVRRGGDIDKEGLN